MTEPTGNGNDLVDGNDEKDRLDDAESAGGELVDADDISNVLAVIRNVAEVERRRVEAQEARNKIALRALEVSENSDLRQFEYRKEKLATEERAREKSHSLARTVLRWGGGAALLLGAFVISMAFFGNEEQSRIAVEMIEVAGKAMGGAGFIYLVAVGMRRLTKH